MNPWIKSKQIAYSLQMGRKITYKHALRLINREHDNLTRGGSSKAYQVKALPGGKYGRGSLK